MYGLSIAKRNKMYGKSFQQGNKLYGLSEQNVRIISFLLYFRKNITLSLFFKIFHRSEILFFRERKRLFYFTSLLFFSENTPQPMSRSIFSGFFVLLLSVFFWLRFKLLLNSTRMKGLCCFCRSLGCQKSLCK